MVIAVATKIVIGKADRDGRVAVRQGNGCDNDFTAAMAIPCFTGDRQKVSIGELSSVAICGTVLFSEESVIVEPLVLQVTLARVVVDGMEFLSYVRRQKPIQEAILLVSISEGRVLAGR